MTTTHAVVVFHSTDLNPPKIAGGKNFVNNNYVYPTLIVLHEFILFGQFVCKSAYGDSALRLIYIYICHLT